MQGVVESSKAMASVKPAKEPVSGREGSIPAKNLGLWDNPSESDRYSGASQHSAQFETRARDG